MLNIECGTVIAGFPSMPGSLFDRVLHGDIMNLRQRFRCVLEKSANYLDELAALRHGGAAYFVGMGILLVILFPVFLLELLFVLLLGKDTGLFASTETVLPPVLKEEDVPQDLRELIPLARKFGVGDDADRDGVMRAASVDELLAMQRRVAPRAQAISDWIDTFPESEMTDTAGCFLYLLVANEEVNFYIPEQDPG